MAFGEKIAATTILESVGTCSECGIEHAMPSHMLQSRRNDGKNFYCPNGHSQVFKKPRVAELEEQLALVRADRAKVQERLWAAEREVAKRDRKLARVNNGVCPDCNRTFQNLARHRKTKHHA